MTHTLLNEKVVSLYITFATLSFHRVSICTFGHVGIRGEAGDLLNEKNEFLTITPERERESLMNRATPWKGQNKKYPHSTQ